MGGAWPLDCPPQHGPSALGPTLVSDEGPNPIPTRRARILAAAIVAGVAVAYTYSVAARSPGFVSDFDQIWVAARALMAGENPYRAVTTGFAGVSALSFPLFYPAPALVAGVPFAFLPLVAARAAFAAVSIGVVAYLLTARGWWALAALLSAPAFLTVSLVQWSGWLAAAAVAPSLGWALACKPNAGLSVLCTARSARAVWVALASATSMALVSFALQPGWVGDWLSALRGQPHFRPYVLRPGGFLLLLALLRWRRPEARWLAALACIPGTPGLQEALVFFMFALSFRQLLVMGLLSHAAMWVAYPARQAGDFYSYVEVAAMANLALMYLPALVLVLRRPNEGDAPHFVDRVAGVLAALARRS